MNQHLFALLVHDRPELFEPLMRALRGLSVETYSVSTCLQVENFVTQCKPQIIFTQNSLADGSWSVIDKIAKEANVPVSVIVVGNHPDTRLYLSVMEHGAFDFIAPPFEQGPLKFIVRSAALSAQRRREALHHVAVA